MKRRLIAGLALTAVTAATPAVAATFTLSNYSVALHTEDPGLVLYANDIASRPYVFELSGVGAAHTIPLFRIGTNESEVASGEDTVDYPISVLFEFSTPPPAFGGTVTGTTDGFSTFLGACSFIFGGCGRVTWDNPTLLNFGESGVLSVFLTPRTFGTPGSARIDATFVWERGELGDGGNNNPNAVTPAPEPTSLALIGAGLAVTASRIRRYRQRRRQEAVQEGSM